MCPCLLWGLELIPSHLAVCTLYSVHSLLYGSEYTQSPTLYSMDRMHWCREEGWSCLDFTKDMKAESRPDLKQKIINIQHFAK